MTQTGATLAVKRMGIDTYKHPVIYMLEDCSVCKAEGFEAQTRIRVTHGDHFIIATLNTVHGGLLSEDEVGLSEYAWELLKAKSGDKVLLSHAMSLTSLSAVRAKIYGQRLSSVDMQAIIQDVAVGRYSEIHLASFLTACTSQLLDASETFSLTQAMVGVGDRIKWTQDQVVDKHSVGGLPGNRTSLIIVPIVAEYGLTIPKTSSRAITSPAGTADTMEIFAPVNLSVSQMRNVVEQEMGCIIWGGAVTLSPADNILVRVESVLDLDSEGQMVASVLSKKLAVGSTDVVIDMPIGPTAKVRSLAAANRLKKLLDSVAEGFGIHVRVIFTEGTQPIGCGIGPALEAHDVMAVLQNQATAPHDLRERALLLAGHVLECSSKVNIGQGYHIAKDILDSGKAWKKFQAICQAQGGFSQPPVAKHQYTVEATKSGTVSSVNNRLLARVAKLAGAPRAKAAGVHLEVRVGDHVEKGQPLFVVHAEAKGELTYVINTLAEAMEIFSIE